MFYFFTPKSRPWDELEESGSAQQTLHQPVMWMDTAILTSCWGQGTKREAWRMSPSKDFKSVPCTIAIGRHLMLESDHLIKQINHFSSQGRTRKVERTAEVSHSSPTASTSKKGMFLSEKQGLGRGKGSFTIWHTERNTSLTKLTGDQSCTTTYYGELSVA